MGVVLTQGDDHERFLVESDVDSGAELLFVPGWPRMSVEDLR